MLLSKYLIKLSIFVFPSVALMYYFFSLFSKYDPFMLSIAGSTFLIAVVVMTALEYVFKYEKGVSQNDRLPRDFTSMMMNLYFTGFIAKIILVPALVFMPTMLFGRDHFLIDNAQNWPAAIQIILAVGLYSFLRYSIHYFQHKIPVLWELHSYHHSITDLKAMNTLVSHPLDYIMRNYLPPIIVASVGFDPIITFFGIATIQASGVFSHFGAGVRAGWLNYIFVTPELHRWHHSSVTPEGHKYAVNFGVGFILWDRLFGTFYLPEENGVPLQPDRLGHPSGYADETNYFKLFFLTRYWPKLGANKKEVEN